MCFVNTLRMTTECCIFLTLLLLSYSASQIQFTSRYKGQYVTGLIGSSVNFTWGFSGGSYGVRGVLWGLKRDGVSHFLSDGILVVVDESGSPVSVPSIPAEYNGRVCGIRRGNKFSGEVIFTLNSIKNDDERFYGCQLTPINNFDNSDFDSVYLVVEEAPNITHPRTEGASFNEGSPVNISCKATGQPDPDVTWIHNGLLKHSGSKTAYLTFNKISKANAGMYTCRANNSVGRTEKKLYFLVNYQAIIESITSSVSKSWIGETVKLTCKSDGVPTPTLSWYKPDGTKFNTVKSKESTAHVKMNSDNDFGNYNCTAYNGFVLASMIVHVRQIKAPGSANITADIQATSLTVKWTAPADDGGSPITAYRVVVLQGDTEISNKNITDPATKSWVIGGLMTSTSYIVKVYARNFVFEGDGSQTMIKTMLKGVPEAAVIIDLPVETKEVEVTIIWNEAQDNGAPITQYTVYQRTVREDGTSGEWNKIYVITAVSVREVAVKLEKGKKYEFVVTATNKFGEGFKEQEKIKETLVIGDVPAAVEITDGLILKWKEPNNNGAAITLYTVYQRVVNEEQWQKIGTITDISKREYVVEIEKGKEFEFVVTATNKYGESSKEDNIKRVLVLEVSTKQPEIQAGSVTNKEGLLHGVYVSVILLLSIIILILTVVFWRLRRRLDISHPSRIRKSVRREEFVAMRPMAAEVEPTTQPSSAMQQDDVVTYEIPGGGDYMPLHPSGRSWEISREQVKVIKVIGKGAFSEVAKATLWNLRENQEYITVAAKMLKANAPDSDRKDLLSELGLMKKLKPHPHVIKLVGCVIESDPLLVLIEYVPFGDLLGYLRKSRGLEDTYFKDPDVKPQTSLTAGQLMKFAWQVADGMSYLSSKKIIHRDLAARNVLVGEGEKCKVTDFGMARNVQQDDIYARKSRGRLPVKWTAYEALLYGTYTTQSDVWSYGILLYEILTVGGSPYPDIKPRQIAEKLQEGFRMPKPKHVDDKLYQIMLKCWEEQPTDRPTFDKLRKTMKEMERKHKTYVNLSQYDDSQYANVNDLTEE